MHVIRVWHVLYLFGFVVASLCVNEIEYEGNYADIYDNEISQDQQEGEFCLFILLSFCLCVSCLFEQMDHCGNHYLNIYLFGNILRLILEFTKTHIVFLLFMKVWQNLFLSICIGTFSIVYN